MASMRIVTLAVAALLLCALMAPATAEEQSVELGILGGIVYLDEDLAGSGGPAIEPTIGLRLGGPLPLGSFGWFTDALYADIDTETFRLGARSIALRGGLEWRHPDMHVNPWFIALGLGYHDLSFDQATDYDSAFVSAGIGQKIWLGGRKQLRWELRGDHSLAKDGLMGQDITQPQFLVGLSWDLGGKRGVADSDGDGVADRRDRCPGTAPGRAVTRKGCTLEPEPGAAQPEAEIPVVTPIAPGPDADGDGVADADDRCPATLLGIEVDEQGCPLDEDGDGVYDGLGMDRCPGTPPGTAVDRYGCPLDSAG